MQGGEKVVGKVQEVKTWLAEGSLVKESSKRIGRENCGSFEINNLSKRVTVLLVTFCVGLLFVVLNGFNWTD